MPFALLQLTWTTVNLDFSKLVYMHCFYSLFYSTKIAGEFTFCLQIGGIRVQLKLVNSLLDYFALISRLSPSKLPRHMSKIIDHRKLHFLCETFFLAPFNEMACSERAASAVLRKSSSFSLLQKHKILYPLIILSASLIFLSFSFQPVLQGNGVKTAGTIVLASMELSATLWRESVLVHRDGMVIFLNSNSSAASFLQHCRASIFSLELSWHYSGRDPIFALF